MKRNLPLSDTHLRNIKSNLYLDRELLVSYLGEHSYRFRHTYLVCQEMKELYLALSVEQRRQASLFYLQFLAYYHDIAKELPLEQQISLCEQYHISIPEGQEYPQIVHGAVVAPLLHLHKNWWIPDAHFSWMYHTTGHMHLSFAGILLYIADSFASWNQNAPWSKHEMQNWMRTKSVAFIASLCVQSTFQYLGTLKQQIHPTSSLFLAKLESQLSSQEKKELWVLTRALG